MSNEMPEKILKPCPFCGNERVKPELGYDNGGLPGCGNCGAIISRYGGSYDLIEAWNQRTDTIPDVAELQRQNAALKEFAKATWDVLDEQAFEAGASLGVFDTDQHGGYAFAYWMLTDTAAMPAPSKAKVAREFLDAIEKRAKKLRQSAHYNGYNEDAWQVSLDEARGLILKEWEDGQ